jgi:hypothetical protein
MAEVAYSTYKMYVAAKSEKIGGNGNLFRLAARMTDSEKDLGIKPPPKKKVVFAEYEG